MNFNVAINGYGRVGQSLLRALYQRPELGFKIHAINELAEIETIAYLTRYDSTHGRFNYPVDILSNRLLKIQNDEIHVSSEQDINNLEWDSKCIDLVFDCTGSFSSKSELTPYVNLGIPKLLLSHPGDGSLDKTIVFSVNQNDLSQSDQIISAASCTSNAVVPVLKSLDDALSIESGTLTTIHSAMNDQPVIDAYHHNDLRRTRSAMHNIVPVDTGLVRGVERILPELENKLSATAIRVPTMNVSAMEVCLKVERNTNTDEVNRILEHAMQNDQFGIINFTQEPLASCDFLQDSHSCNIDGSQTRVSGGSFIKVLIWFDNEWAFANRMLDVANYWLSQPQ